MTELFSYASPEWLDDNATTIVWVAWTIGGLAVVALVLLAIGILQRLRPLSRALARMEERQRNAQAISAELQRAKNALDERSR